MALQTRLRPTRSQWLRTLILFAVGVVLFLIILAVVPRPQPKPIAAGNAPPALSLDDIAGRHHDVLAEGHGQRVLVEFFATTCPTCQAQAGHLCAVAQAHHDLRVYVVDAELESAQTVADFQHTRMAGCPVTFLLDPGDTASHAWSVTVVPTVYVLGSDGRIAFGGIGAAGLSGIDTALTP